jgi:hypothetical protein
MFTTEQNIAKAAIKTSKKRFLNAGMPLAKEVSVKYRITYKEVTLILGVVVAILVALTLWVINPAEQPGSHAAIFPGLSPLTITRGVLFSLAELIF